MEQATPTEARDQPDAGSEAAPTHAQRAAQRILMWAILLFACQRSLVVFVASTPWVTPDEYGAWAIAAALVAGGDAPMTMRDTPLYSLASGALLAPIEFLNLEPTLAYRLAVVWLSGVVLVAALLVRSAVGHLRPGNPTLREGAFAVTLLFPATTVTTSFTWAETAVLLWWSLFFAATVGTFVRRRAGWTIAAGAIAGTAPVVHGRLAAVPLIWLAVLLLGRLRRTAPLLAAASGAVTVLVGVASWKLERFATGQVWDSSARPRALELPDAAGEAVSAALSATAGQLWYLLAASAGLAVLGMAGLAGGLLGRPERAGWVEPQRHRAGSDLRLLAAVLSAALASNLLMSAGFMARAVAAGPSEREFGGLRWDHLVYGRYIDGAAVLLSVLGLLVLAEALRNGRATRLFGTAAAGTALLAVLVSLTAPSAGIDGRLDLTIAGVAWFPTRPAGLQLGLWTITAIALMALLAFGAARSPRSLLAAMAAWLAVGSSLATLTVVEHHRDRTHPPLAAQLGSPDSDRPTAAIASDVEHLGLWRLGVFAQQRDLVHLGWKVEVLDESSVTVASAVEHSTGALVLLGGVEPNGNNWQPVTEFGGATLWRRDHP